MRSVLWVQFLHSWWLSLPEIVWRSHYFQQSWDVTAVKTEAAVIKYSFYDTVGWTIASGLYKLAEDCFSLHARWKRGDIVMVTPEVDPKRKTR